MLAGDPSMATACSRPLNLGLLDPSECARAETAYREGRAARSAEGYIRQLVGWRDYVWHPYWHFGPDYRRRNALRARRRVPEWFAELDADAAGRAASHVLRQVRDRGWTHHIPRLMVLGNYGLQRGWTPAELTDWFHRCFVDGYDWVMAANVIGMSQYADGGAITTKPYAAGGAYIDRMSDYCRACAYDPPRGARTPARTRPATGPSSRATRAADRQPPHAPGAAGLDRLPDLEQLVEQEERRGNRAP